jgi:DNA polymerase-4
MQRLAAGIDNRDVIPFHEVKSIGHELTFSNDILDVENAKKELLSLSNKVAHRMRQHSLTGKTLALKVKYSDFVQITRSTTLPEGTDDGYEIYSNVCHLIDKTQVGKRPVRLLGVSLSQLNTQSSGEQLSLFQQDITSRKRQSLNKALDSLYEKHGKKSIQPGTLIDD